MSIRVIILFSSFLFLIIVTNSEFSNRILDFTIAKEYATDTISLIHHRYEMGNSYYFQFFQISSNIPINAWEILKYKFASKIVQGHQQFHMIFGGSSVTAGHDNFFNQSYPAVFQRRMQSIFDGLGLKLVVDNIAQGANQCIPSDFCYLAMGGSSPDWIGWEQSYNCGRDVRMHELIARVAGWEKAVVYYSASGGFKPSECNPSTDPIPWISSSWTPEQVNPPLPKLNCSHNYVKALKVDLDQWHQDGPSEGRFSAPLTDPGYKGVGAHGHSVWATNGHKCRKTPDAKPTGCTAIDVRGPCYDKGGPHWLTKEGSVYGSAGGGGAAHHPSVGMHQLRGEILAWLYSHILLDAIYEIEGRLRSLFPSSPSSSSENWMHLTSTKRSKILSELQESLIELQPDLPHPKTCSPLCDHPPICHTDYLPHANPNLTLTELILLLPPSPSSSASSSTPTTTSSSSATDNSTATTISTTTATATATTTLFPSSNWNRIKKSFRGEVAATYGYLDERVYYELSGPHASLSLHLEIPRHDGKAILCGYSVKESLKHAIFLLHVNGGGGEMMLRRDRDRDRDRDSSKSNRNEDEAVVKSESESSNIPTSTSTTTTTKFTSPLIILKRKYLGDECTMLHDLPLGRHILTIQNKGGELVALSHVIII